MPPSAMGPVGPRAHLGPGPGYFIFHIPLTPISGIFHLSYTLIPISIYPSLLSARIFHLSYTPHSYQPGYFIFIIYPSLGGAQTNRKNVRGIKKNISQNGVCLVWKLLGHLGRVFLRYLEPPSSHIRQNPTNDRKNTEIYEFADTFQTVSSPLGLARSRDLGVKPAQK